MKKGFKNLKTENLVLFIKKRVKLKLRMKQTKNQKRKRKKIEKKMKKEEGKVIMKKIKIANEERRNKYKKKGNTQKRT